MRGDSLRDFYAKTLAVLGLGLIAGAGAAVDYWPVNAPLPVVIAVRLPAPEVPVLAQRLDQRIPAPAVAHRPLVIRGTIHAKNIGTARFLPKASPAPVVEITTTPAAQPAAVPDTVAPVEDQWTAFSPAPQFVQWNLEPPTSAAPSGFIGGALRKTKDSIVKTGAVSSAALVTAGSTIADTFKGVVGAFKKVSPF